MFISGLAIFLVFSGLTITFTGGSLMDFISLPSLLMLVIPLVALMTATKSFKIFYGGLKAVVMPKTSITEQLRGQAASLFRFLSKSTAMISGIMILLNIVGMLMGIDFMDQHAANNTARNTATAFIVLIYGLLLIVAVFEPVVFNLKKRHEKKLS